MTAGKRSHWTSTWMIPAHLSGLNSVFCLCRPFSWALPSRAHFSVYNTSLEHLEVYIPVWGWVQPGSQLECKMQEDRHWVWFSQHLVPFLRSKFRGSLLTHTYTHTKSPFVIIPILPCENFYWSLETFAQICTVIRRPGRLKSHLSGFSPGLVYFCSEPLPLPTRHVQGGPTGNKTEWVCPQGVHGPSRHPVRDNGSQLRWGSWI